MIQVVKDYCLSRERTLRTFCVFYDNGGQIEFWSLLVRSVNYSMRAFTESCGDIVYVNISKMNLRTVMKGLTGVSTILNRLHDLGECLELTVFMGVRKKSGLDKC